MGVFSVCRCFLLLQVLYLSISLSAEECLSSPDIDTHMNTNDVDSNKKECDANVNGMEAGAGSSSSSSTQTHANSNHPGTDERIQPWKWDVDAVHRCNIKKMSHEELFKRHRYGLPPLYHQPIILYDNRRIHTNTHHEGQQKEGPCTPSKFTEMTSIENITKTTFPQDFMVTLSSSNSYSAHRRSVTLAQYVDETLKEEVLPHQLSNLTWYLFGETYSDDWREKLLDYYCLPPCQTCTNDLSALSFGIGGKGSGVQWHVHGPGFSESIHGKKHWVLYPPDQKPDYDPDYTSRHWMEEVYTTLVSSSSSSSSSKTLLPFECTVMPGEMIYFPNGWHHATINLSPYTAFVSTFTTEYGIEAKS